MNNERVESCKGFSLIELLIVIAIVGVVAGVAVPLYLDYSVRSKVAEGIMLIASAKSAVVDYQQVIGSFPISNLQAGLNATLSGNHVASVAIGVNGVITIVYAASLGLGLNNQIQFVPTSNNGSVAWSCNGLGTTVEDKYLPQNCR